MHGYELRLADLIFVRGRRWFDFPIKFATNSQYTHVAGCCGFGLLIEAQGLRRTGFEVLSAYKGKADVYRCPHLTELQVQQIMKFAHKEVGGRYDYLLIAWEAVRCVFGIILPYIKNKRRICSTLWSDAYKLAGVDLCPNQRYPTPADLVKSPLLRKVGSL